MELSVRLNKIASMVESSVSIVDVGTDHGYIPIYLVKKGICNSAIASDINKGPVEKARLNVSLEGLENKIECRLGGGLSTIKPFEVDSAIVAGMGGNLIRDIIEADMDVFKSLKYAILQPVQNPEVLRKHIYNSGYSIIDEELCFDEGKYYEIIKIAYDNKPRVVDEIYYEISEKLINKIHPLINEYINYKIKRYSSIVNSINEDTNFAMERKQEVIEKIAKLKGLVR